MTYVDVALHELNDIQGLGWAGLGCHTATSQNGICYTRQQSGRHVALRFRIGACSNEACEKASR